MIKEFYSIQGKKLIRPATVLTLLICLLTQTAFAGPNEILIGIGAQTGSVAAVPEAEVSGTESTYEIEEQLSEASPEDIADEESWSLILVNKTHPIPDDYVIPELTDLSNGNAIDSRVYPHLQRMFDDARAQGIYPYINSSYRSQEKQQALMDQKIEEYKASGYSDEDARKLAEEWVAIPGTSEHQLGLCIDVTADSSTGQDPGSVWYWMQLNCASYGFIRRYPEDKTDITGIINEPWHYRYVGVHAAKIINEQGICLEEYLGIY